MASFHDNEATDSDDDIPDLSEESEEEEESESDEEPDTPESLKEEGNQYYKQKNYVSAIDSYSRAIQLAEELSAPVPTYYLNRASAYMMKLMYAEAIRDCDSAIELDNHLAKAYFRKGKALLAAGKPQESVAAFTAGLIKDPQNTAAVKERKEAEEVVNRLALAKQCLVKKQYVQVWKQIQMIEKHMSGGADMTMMKIEALCCIGRHNEAYALTTSLMRTNSRYPGLLFWRAKCLYYMDQVPPAIKHLQECMRNDPDNSEYRVELKKWRTMEAQKEAGNEAFKYGRYAEAIEKWGECLTIDPDHRSYNAKLLLNRGTAQAKLKEFKKAVEDCTKAIELDDKYLKAYNKRAECLRILGEKEQIEQAIRDLEKAMELDGDESNERSYKTKLREAKVELKRAGQEDLYKLLGATKASTDAELKKCYKKAALKWHPDRWSNKPEEEQKAAEATFQKINRAFEVLSDPQKRQRYDAGESEEDLDNEHGGHGHGGMSPEMMHMFMRQHMGGGGGFGGGGFPF